jgi:hypothetical protein
MTVWLIETGEYEQRYVMAVCESLAAALAHIKQVFSAPYRVQWQEPTTEDGQTTLRGDFEAVLNYSTHHTAVFDISPCELIREIIS